MKKAKVAVIAFLVILLLFPLLIIPMIGVAIAQIPSITFDWLSSTVTSIWGDLFPDADARTEEWYNNIYPLFSDYLPEDYRQYFLAESISFYYYLDTGESMLIDDLTMDEYMAFFISGTSSAIYDNLEIIGITIPEDDKDKVQQMADTLHDQHYADANPVTPGGGLGTEPRDYSNDEVESIVKPIMNAAAAEGGFSYSPYYYNRLCQCVDISRYYLWVKYKAQSGGGNGCDVARNTYNLSSNAGKFRYVTNWTAGAIFSVDRGYGGNDFIGHTGYVERVDLMSQTIWITEAWGSDGTVHVMSQYFIPEYEAMYPGHFTFIVPA